MNSNPIGIFDSGIGGLSVLKDLIKLMPNENYIYYSDTLNNPYGSKDNNELIKITSSISEYLLDKKCKVIVIACNTATVACINALREKYQNTIFIGVVPAIKIAYDQNFKNTLVLATPNTVKSKRLAELVAKYKHPSQIITLVPCPKLASAIERGNDIEIDKTLDEELQDYKEKPYDSIVLGCTHYSLITDKIGAKFPKAKIIDGNNGIARETKRQLEIHNLLNNSGNSHIDYYNSDKSKIADINKIMGIV